MMVQICSQSTQKLLAARIYECGVQLTTRAGERGHHGTNGNRCNRCDLLVGTTFELSKHKNCSVTGWQSLEGTGKALPTFIGDGHGFGSGSGLRVQFFVEFDHQLPRAIFVEPGVARIAHDLQQPGAHISTLKAAEETARAKQGFLSD